MKTRKMKKKIDKMKSHFQHCQIKCYNKKSCCFVQIVIKCAFFGINISTQIPTFQQRFPGANG